MSHEENLLRKECQRLESFLGNEKLRADPNLLNDLANQLRSLLDGFSRDLAAQDDPIELEPALQPVGPRYLHEEDIPDLDLSTESGYCMDLSSLQGVNARRKAEGKPPLTKTYFDWEREVAQPKLEEMGYETNGYWYDGESDSFGPMTRCLLLKKDNKAVVFCYG